ncbi:MAG: energy transducer TonB [Alphaproteobacteria bacterium]|nr:energy transducer TonB [Alphaproteobacteria bacterium]MBV9372654.1 energy transducer TonB [Alphaproteobacteria bacterium]MBV9900196.1 energy transducer TonB [Alphaproteobacteria bacterium]
MALAAAATPASSTSPITVNRPPGSATTRVPLSAYVTEDDYPAAAIRSGAQGTVVFRLSVGPDGRVVGCEVTGSSGSDLLDSTTCRLMVRRARFTPATDPQGRPRSDTFDGYFEWRLPEQRLPWTPLPERPGAAMDLWSQCTWARRPGWRCRPWSRPPSPTGRCAPARASKPTPRANWRAPRPPARMARGSSGPANAIS